MKIVNKIGLSFLFVSLILVSMFLSIFYFIVKLDLQNFIHNNLVAVASSRAGNIVTYLDMLGTSVGQLSKSVELYDFLEIDNKESPQRLKAFELSMKLLKVTKESNPSVFEFLLLDKSGKIVSSSNESSLGIDNSTDSYFLGGRDGPFIKSAYYSPAKKSVLMAVAAPIISKWTGKLIGVLVAKVKMADLDDIVLHRAGMGKSGEVYIVNKYGYMITPSAFKKDAVFKQRIDVRNINKPYSGKIEPASVFNNYMGSMVLRTTIQIPRMAWTVVAEIGANEALWPLVKIRRIFLAMLLLVPIVAWLLGIFIARTITRPLYKLQEGATAIGEGNLDHMVGTDARDEIGQLSRAFDMMTQNLKLTTTSIDKLSKEIIERMAAENRAQKWAEELEKKIGELKRTQNMLVHSEKMASLGTLVSEIAHEINNPLMIISGNAQLSSMHEPLDIEIKNNMKVIMEECQRAKGIIERVLRFAKPSKGKAKDVEINKSIESIVLIIEKTFKMANVKIKRNYLELPVTVLSDEQHLHEVFMNILNNAKDAMPEGGTITITTSLHDSFVRIDFKDNGTGMPEEAKRKIFEPFFTTKEKGTGLGLSICYGIIKALNGEITFDSELNKGTTFTVMLPLKK